MHKQHGLFLFCEVIAEANEVAELLLGKLAGVDNFDAAFAKVARLHNGLVFGLESVAEFAVATDF